MRTHCLVTHNTPGVYDGSGSPVKEYTFRYTMPFKTGPGQHVESVVCGNAFSWAYGLGKNTRTEYERMLRNELSKQSPDNIPGKTLRYICHSSYSSMLIRYMQPYNMSSQYNMSNLVLYVLRILAMMRSNIRCIFS